MPNIYEQADGYTIIHITGGVNGDADIFIDDEDVEKCKKYNWTITKAHCHKNAKYKYYIQGHGFMLHRYLTDCPKGLVVDHINYNTFDNRKENLRICTNKENTRKTAQQINNKSGKKGVLWDTSQKYPRWLAYIMVDAKHIYLGHYAKFEDAVEARKRAEEKYFGEHNPVEYVDIKTVGIPIKNESA